jgi:hypothetical protein
MGLSILPFQQADLPAPDHIIDPLDLPVNELVKGL